jgi:hypothetical protein
MDQVSMVKNIYFKVRRRIEKCGRAQIQMVEGFRE